MNEWPFGHEESRGNGEHPHDHPGETSCRCHNCKDWFWVEWFDPYHQVFVCAHCRDVSALALLVGGIVIAPFVAAVNLGDWIGRKIWRQR